MPRVHWWWCFVNTWPGLELTCGPAADFEALPSVRLLLNMLWWGSCWEGAEVGEDAAREEGEGRAGPDPLARIATLPVPAYARSNVATQL